jgi:hypothetical protein
MQGKVHIVRGLPFGVRLLQFAALCLVNDFAERQIGSIRRECLDRIVVFGEVQRRSKRLSPWFDVDQHRNRR